MKIELQNIRYATTTNTIEIKEHIEKIARRIEKQLLKDSIICEVKIK